MYTHTLGEKHHFWGHSPIPPIVVDLKYFGGKRGADSLNPARRRNGHELIRTLLRGMKFKKFSPVCQTKFRRMIFGDNDMLGGFG
jgi:hypothetical protein